MGIIMAKLRRATVLDDLPDCIVVQEILVRLPPKDVLRCRAVCKSWRSATSTDKFMLDNCRRQPSLPLIRQHIPGQKGVSFHVFRDDRAGSSNQKLWPIIHDSELRQLLGACDGLLIMSVGSDIWICNPATRKYAPLPQPRVPSSSSGGSIIYIAGFYRHHPSGEYRVLWFSDGHPTYVLTVGSNKPRIIRRPPMTPSLPEHGPRRSLHSCYSLLVNHRDSLHW
ncbi:hypothetical protein ZWY2020_036229 [Hordeum vulgare]|nr:hypothetical protein ZWY2020_036229 [Hordeum vulgare]